MPEQTTSSNEVMAFELSVIKMFHDSVSSLGSLSSWDDSERDLATNTNRQTRRASLVIESDETPRTPTQKRDEVRRPHSTDGCSIHRKRNFAMRGKAPTIEATKEKATTSLRTLLATQERRSRRMIRDGSSSKLKANSDLDFGSSHHSRFSRRRMLADRKSDAGTTTTAETSSRALDLGSAHSLRKFRLSRGDSCDSFGFDQESSFRWASQSVKSMCMEDSVKAPKRQHSQELDNLARVSTGTKDTAFSTLCQESIDIIEAHPLNDQSSVENGSKDCSLRQPKRQNTNASNEVKTPSSPPALSPIPPPMPSMSAADRAVSAPECPLPPMDRLKKPARQVTNPGLPENQLCLRPKMELPKLELSKMERPKKPTRQVTIEKDDTVGPSLPKMERIPKLDRLSKPRRQVTNPGTINEE